MFVSAVVCPHTCDTSLYSRRRSWLDHGTSHWRAIDYIVILMSTHEKDWSHSNLYLMHMLIMCANTLNYI
jgi:hypothetical protein